MLALKFSHFYNREASHLSEHIGMVNHHGSLIGDEIHLLMLGGWAGQYQGSDLTVFMKMLINLMKDCCDVCMCLLHSVSLNF